MESEKKIRIITHNGNFHVDDLFATAALQILHGAEHTEVLRSRDPEIWKSGDYILDVGGIYDTTIGRYDHHQHGGAGARSNGIPYSALGLVWKHHGEALCGSKEVAERVDRNMVSPIDLADNGIEVYASTYNEVHPFLIHHVLVVMRPTWKEGAVHDERFMELLPWARRIIEREIVSTRDNLEGEQYVKKAYDEAEDKRLIVLNGAYSWQEVLAKTPDAIYVVKPKSQGTNWEIECVRNDLHSFINRKTLPEEWRGYRDEELSQKTGVTGSIFCHNTGFIAVTETKEGALQLAQMALNA